MDIWRECLCVLREINNPRIVHYGAYEIRFLRRMRKRCKLTTEEAEFVDQVVDGSLNLLATIYGTIYFPTYSNNLKDIAHWLGFEWTAPRASGGAAMLWRRCWELTSDDALRRELITYNIEDCRAAALVAEALAHICGNSGLQGATKLETVNVNSLDISFHQTFGKFQSVIPGFEKINATAHWDYQRSKVYVRTRKASRRNVDKTAKPAKKVIVNKEIHVDRPESCPACGAAKLRVRREPDPRCLRFEIHASGPQAMGHTVSLQEIPVPRLQSANDEPFGWLKIWPNLALLCHVPSD